MSAIRGTIQDGKVVFAAPPQWPNGAEVDVELASGHERIGISEEQQGDDPESIARWLAWYDSLEPLILTAEDEERIRQARAEQKAFQLAHWEERSRKLEKLFE
jgi:hypothetical protein